MAASMKMGFSDEFKEKIREVGWFVAIGLLRWLIEYLTRSTNPKSGDGSEGE